MSEKDILKKYDVVESTFVATEEELKIIQNCASDAIQETSNEKTQEAKISRGEFKSVDVSISPIKLEKEIAATNIIPSGEDDLKTDYNYIRNNIYTITERSVEALNNLVQIADQSQHPRAYEVVAILVNTIASAQKDLMSIHQQKAKIDGVTSKNSPDVVNNNLFVGNTAQLDEIISRMSQKKIEDE